NNRTSRMADPPKQRCSGLQLRWNTTAREREPQGFSIQRAGQKSIDYPYRALPGLLPSVGSGAIPVSWTSPPPTPSATWPPLLPLEDAEEVREIIVPHGRVTPASHFVPAPVSPQCTNMSFVLGHERPLRWRLAAVNLDLAQLQVFLNQADQPGVGRQVAEHRLQVEVTV